MVHVRVNEALKDKAAETLSAMGLSISDAVRMLLIRVVAEQAMPFSIKVPNNDTLKAMQEAKEDDLPSFSNIPDLMKALNEKN